ncbi:MAG: hypothetical protein MRY74_08420 [Neomegalonema sp.]|nr:hypothetical protein [Neomegalonema sp.]
MFLEILTSSRLNWDIFFVALMLAWLAACYFFLYQSLFYTESEKRAKEIENINISIESAYGNNGRGAAQALFYILIALVFFTAPSWTFYFVAKPDLDVSSISERCAYKTDLFSYLIYAACAIMNGFGNFFEVVDLSGFFDWPLHTKLACVISLIISVLTRRILSKIAGVGVLLIIVYFVGLWLFS